MTTRFVNQITLGNAVTVIGMVVAIFLAWGTTQTRIAALEQHDTEIQRQIDEDATETSRVRPDVEARLRAVETRFGAALVELDGLKANIAELKQALRETNEQLREVAVLLRAANGRE